MALARARSRTSAKLKAVITRVYLAEGGNEFLHRGRDEVDDSRELFLRPARRRGFLVVASGVVPVVLVVHRVGAPLRGRRRVRAEQQPRLPDRLRREPGTRLNQRRKRTGRLTDETPSPGGRLEPRFYSGAPHRKSIGGAMKGRALTR